jgi:hypothetical protein
MISIFRAGLAAGFLFGLQAAGLGQEELASGPRAGAPLTPVMVYAPSGRLAGQELDAAKALGQGPGVLLFVHELSRNTAPMISGLDRLADEYSLLGLRTFTVLLARDRTAAENQLKRSSDSLRLLHPMVYSLDGVEGPGAYALNRKCTLTVVTAKGGKVARSVALTDTGRQDVERLRGWIEELTGPLPSDESELRKLLESSLPEEPAALRERALELALEVLRLRRQLERARAEGGMRPEAAAGPRRAAAAEARPPAGERPQAARQEGKPPEDPELRRLLRAAIRREASKEELDATFSAIDERVGDDEGLRREAVDMFRLMVSLGYGSDDASERAKAYVAKHAARKES